jgi:UDP-4-amino-4,6-dideoxy-N-acetyl-beta-L-altrosamine N-acetyltransferase
MKITRYGVTLERLLSEHSEMVRQWRNDQKISQFMFYKGEITTAMQQEWFTSIDNEQNFFFVINYKSALIGLINISSIDWENKTSYVGLFIYDEKFWASDVPVMASLAMLDVFFLLFDIQSAYAKVKGNNKVAHKYNSSLGFSRTKKIEQGLGYEYMLQKEIYLLETKEIRNAAIRLKGNDTVIELLKGHTVDAWIGDRLAKAKKEVVRNLDVSIVLQA